MDHLVELLKHVHEHPEEAQEKGRQARQDMQRRFSPSVIQTLLEEEFQRFELGKTTRDEL